MRRLIAFLTAMTVGALLGFGGGFATHVPVNSLWVPVVAALGASFLTATAAIGLELVREHYRHGEQRRAERRDSYVQFLAASAKLIVIAGTMRELRRIGTGLAPRARITNAVEFFEEFNRQTATIHDAWSLVWLAGSQEAITAANRLMEASMPAIATATAPGVGRHSLISAVIGERWTADQDREFGDALQVVGRERRLFAEVARKETGAEIANLLSGSGT